MSGRLMMRRASSVAADMLVPAVVCGWPVRVERPGRSRRMKLTVEADHVRLVWPDRVSAGAASGFFEQHREWLERTISVHRQADDRAIADLALDPLWPGRVPWFGRILPIHWEAGPARLDIGGTELRCRLPLHQGGAHKVAQRLLIRGLTDALAMRSRVWLREYEPLAAARTHGLRVRPMRSLWGSLSPQGMVSLNLALAFAPEHLAEYVLVHELAHVHQRDHSPRYWQVVAQLYPDYQRCRRQLNQEHRYLQALLRRLYAQD